MWFGGFWPAPGWDTIDEVKANMLGFTTHSFDELHLVHHRITGSADGWLGGLVKNGRANYISGYHPLFMLAKCARRLIASGCEYVLVTGTHENTPQVVNTLYGQEGLLRSDSWQRLPGSYHGSGCTLASAIAATIANGLPIGEAVKDAQEYTWQTLKKAYRPGMGQLLPDRLFWAREETEAHGDAPEPPRAADLRGSH